MEQVAWQSAVYAVSDAQLAAMNSTIAQWQAVPGTYVLMGHNCGNFVSAVLNAGQVNYPMAGLTNHPTSFIPWADKPQFFVDSYGNPSAGGSINDIGMHPGNHPGTPAYNYIHDGGTPSNVPQPVSTEQDISNADGSITQTAVFTDGTKVVDTFSSGAFTETRYAASGVQTEYIQGRLDASGNAQVTFGGTGPAVSVNNATITMLANSQLQVTGSGDHIIANNPGDTITIGGNGSGGTGALNDDVHGIGATVTILNNSNVNVYDTNAKITAGLNDNFGAYGSGLTVTAGTGSNVWVGTNGALSSGANTDIVYGTPGTVTIANNSNVTVNASNVNVVGGTQDTFGVSGSNNKVTAQAGDSVWIGGNGQNAAATAIDVLHATGATVTINDNSRVDIYDSNATIYGGANDNFGAYGAGLTVKGTATDNVWAGGNGETGALTTIYGAANVAIQDNSHVVDYGAVTIVGGAYDSIGIQNTNNATVTINGNWSETYTFAPNITVYDYGQYDLSVGQATNTITYDYGNWGQVNNLSTYDYGYQYGQNQQGYNSSFTDTILNSFSTDILDTSFTPYYSSFDWGYAGNRSAVDKSVANHVVPDAVAKAGGNGQQMFDRLQLAIDTASNATVTGARFDHGTITWAFDNAVNVTDAEAAAASSAVAAWASASGLHFQQTNGAAADIVLTFSDLDTANTGVVGLTSSQSVHGATQPGVLIRVEDPGKTPLVADASGQMFYAGTEATLAQVFMHEIGHALGLGDNADPASIESYYLGSGNRSISVADANAIHYLYSGPNDGGPYVSQQVLNVMQLFASFAPEHGASAVHLVGIVHGPVAIYEGGGGV